MTTLRRLAVVTTVATYVLVTVGGLVRATGSGLGCPDWPRCHGSLIPPPDFHAWVEYSHRLTASVVIVLTLVLAAAAWRARRRLSRTAVRLALATVPIVFSQALLGALVVALDLHAESVVAHLLVAMTLVAFLIALLVEIAVPQSAGNAGRAPADHRFALALSATAAGALVLMLLGSYVSGRGAGLAFPDWPLFDGRLLPAHHGILSDLHFAHRLLAAVVAVAIFALARRARRRPPAPAVTRLVRAAAVLVGVEVLVGAGNVWTRLSPVTRTAHLALGALLWGTLFAASRLAWRLPAPLPADVPAAPAPTTGATVTPAARARAYLALTKPRIIELLLVTTVPAMVLADRGLPSPWLVLAVLFGGTLAAAGANTFNCVVDRDIDEKMRRTHRRPLPAGMVSPDAALRFGIALEVVAFVWLAATVNLLAALLSVGATAFYVFVYTMWLKRSTSQNIVIGGAAGAVPVLVGWAAVTGRVGLPAWVMFAIVFMWTPPHFWALAMRYRDDYAAAGIPMLPVVAGPRAAARQILAYSVVLVAVTLTLCPAAQMGPVYLVAALVLGARFLHFAHLLSRDNSPGAALRLFSYSITYLGLLFAAIALDAVLLS
jgi:protoheme IX farnesyltransferase